MPDLPAPPFRVLLADDHAVFRAGLEGLLQEQGDFVVVAQTGRGDEVLALVEQQAPDLVVLDVQMPGLSGPEVACQINRLGRGVRIVGLSAYEDAAYVERFARCGATGYVPKTRPPRLIVEALRQAAEGHPVWLVRQPLSSPVYLLSPREREVLTLLADGRTNESIAEHLLLSDSTVRNTLTSVYEKLGVSNARAAVAWAWRNKLVEAGNSES